MPNPRPSYRGRVPDSIFADPRLAAIYDEIDGDRLVVIAHARARN